MGTGRSSVHPGQHVRDASGSLSTSLTMNEQGKSDRPVVPEKSSNKIGQPKAEEMEGRGLTKGNLPQQNAFRTQRRMDAPSALKGVRRAASEDKKLQFTALLHHIYNPETLHRAYLLRGKPWRASTARRGSTTVRHLRRTSRISPIG